MKSLAKTDCMIFIRRLPVYCLLYLFSEKLCSCNKIYYWTNTTRQVNADTLRKLIAEKKHFILHNPKQVFELQQPFVDSQDLVGQRLTLGRAYYLYVHPRTDRLNAAPRVKNRMSFTNSQVHVYTDSVLPVVEQISLPISRVKRVDVYSADTGSEWKKGVGINLSFQPVPGYRVVGTVGFLFSPRYIFDERDKSYISLGLPMGIGFTRLDDSNSVDLKLGITIDLPLILNYNHSWRSAVKGLSRSGYFAGAGVGYHFNYYTAANDKGTVTRQISGFGPVVNAGLRFSLHEESRYNVEIRFSYMKTIESSRSSIFTIGCILNF